MLLEQQVNIIEGFLKDHVALKTEAMAAENSAFQIENSYFKL